MKKSQLALLAVAVVAVALIAVISGGGGDGDDGGSTNAGGPAPQTAPAGAIRVTFAYSPEKEELLKPLIASFNASEPKEGGKPVFVTGENMASGDAQLKIAKQTYKPTAWSPSSSMWGRLLNFEADRPYVADENASIVRTPLVIAMWEPMAKVLGYPRRKLGFKDILKLARSDKGWAAYGHPEFGDFKLVHTNPDFSTSGLSAVVAEYYSATGKKEGLHDARHREGARARSRTSSARSCTTATRRSSSPTRCARAARATPRRWRWRRRRSSTSTRTATASRSSSRSTPPRARSSPTTRSSSSTRRG